MHTERQMTVATWNVEKGGNTKYLEDYKLPALPPYYPEILKGIEVLKNHGVEIITLIDTHGWPAQISTEDLRQDTGFPFAVTVPLKDNRFLVDGMDTSITLLTDLPVKSFKILRLQTTNCLRVTVRQETADIDIYPVYLDYTREKNRIAQTADLVKEISARNRLAVVMGDFNSTSPLDSTEISRLFFTTFETLPKSGLPNRFISPVSVRVLNFTHRLTEKYRNHGPIEYLTSEGMTDSSTVNRSGTFPTQKMFPVPFINVDHILVSPGITLLDTAVLTHNEFNASDHYPRIANLKIA